LRTISERFLPSMVISIYKKERGGCFLEFLQVLEIISYRAQVLTLRQKIPFLSASLYLVIRIHTIHRIVSVTAANFTQSP
jgi:ACT domain-containing protein